MNEKPMMRLCIACDGDIVEWLAENHPSNQFCVECVEKAFLAMPLPWYRCAECKKPCTDEYGFADEVAFCGREHKDTWLMRRARTLMSPEELRVLNYSI